MPSFPELVRWKRYANAALAFLILLCLCLVLFCFLFHVLSFDTEHVANITIDVIGCLTLTILFQSACYSKTTDLSGFTLCSIIALETLYLFLDAFVSLTQHNAELVLVTQICVSVYSLCSSLLGWLYWRFLRTWLSPLNGNVKVADGIVNATAIAAASLTICLAVITAVPAWNTDRVALQTLSVIQSFVFPFIITIVCVVLVLSRRMAATSKIVLALYPLLPFFGTAAYLANGISGVLTNLLTFTSMLLLYTNFYIHKQRELEAHKAELAEAKLNAMMLQINPHFIFNTIGSIASLCHDDAQKAETMLFSFSQYLRDNFGELSRHPTVPFVKEIEHLKSYIEIEQLRFPDITVAFDFQSTGFDVPSLSVQPLVENAITHGLMGREDGGTITVSSGEDAAYYYIKIEDDGVGFETLEKHDGRNHIGVENVRKRLQMLCNGELILTSTVNVGTVAEIRIPKGAM